MPKEGSDIELRSTEVQEIFGYIPTWIVRWGTTLVFVVVVVLILISWLLKYPDVVPGRIIITTENPPATVVARASGKLLELRVSEGQYVKRDEVLAVIDNPASTANIRFLKQLLDSGKINKENFILEHASNLTLGDLQEKYSDLVIDYNNYKSFIELDPINNEIELLNLEINEYQVFLSNQIRQRATFELELELSEKEVIRNRDLFQEKVIAEKALDQVESDWLRLKRNYQATSLDISNTKLKLLELKKNQQNLALEHREKYGRLKTRYFKSWEILENGLSDWDYAYVLKAPMEGSLSFFNFWSENQVVRSGEEIFTIIPKEGEKTLAKVHMPIYNSGKVKKGQRVIIKLDDYPMNEYGVVNGRISNISSVPKANSYIVDVELIRGLYTSYNRYLSFKAEMHGSAEIVTEDLRLIQRIFNHFRSLTHSNGIENTWAKSEGDLTFVHSTNNQEITSINLVIADNEIERRQGLMYKKEMPPNFGMLFIFNKSSRMEFHMENTEIPLDIIFVDDKFNIVRIEKNTKPFSLDVIDSKQAAKFVVEVNAGFCDRFNISEGAMVRF